MSQEAVVNRKIQGTQSRSRLRTTIQIAMLSAISAVLMMFEFPLPFLAPPFVQNGFFRDSGHCRNLCHGTSGRSYH